eukprot:scaffold24753_cov108-Isochrysis_galbana.AAC.2
MLAILARQVTRIRAKSFSPTRPFINRAWFSPLSMRCLRPCTPPVRLFSVYSLRVQPSIRQGEPCGDARIGSRRSSERSSKRGGSTDDPATTRCQRPSAATAQRPATEGEKKKKRNRLGREHLGAPGHHGHVDARTRTRAPPAPVEESEGARGIASGFGRTLGAVPSCRRRGRSSQPGRIRMYTNIIPKNEFEGERDKREDG